MKNLFSAIAVFSVVCMAIPHVSAQDSGVKFETGTLVVDTGEAEHLINIEIADSPEETSQGLMFRENLAEDAGMLFDFGEPREPNMWMKNTLIPLDMLFLDDNGVVVAIARNARPHSERRISPGMAVKGVLELAGGATGTLDISPGDVVHHAIFNNVEAAE
ncbi:DUF192 domain-containing protein [Hirschia baltica]|uniref:DUF192 domain-containing protein n=1 Tax=Hirschia baltica (strain ATCC 49814 / DSM 5838 / IFAM 1418) TaxID=582402 RepID=C6XKA1_HIRBI|nr:DUF192 domain-containing protein [Hirschia baltica]ACT59546.1 protein of unknown function DUF192 [Hirschia baltica ATCC 49814]